MEQIIITYAGNRLPYEDLCVINEIIKHHCTDPAKEVTIDVRHNCDDVKMDPTSLEVQDIRYVLKLIINTSVEDILQDMCDYIIEKKPQVIRFIDEILPLVPSSYYGKIRDSLSGTKKDTQLALIKFKKIKDNERLLNVLRNAYGNTPYNKNKI